MAVKYMFLIYADESAMGGTGDISGRVAFAREALKGGVYLHCDALEAPARRLTRPALGDLA